MTLIDSKTKADMSILSEISGIPTTEDRRSLLERLEQTVRDHPDALASICAHQSPGLYGLGGHEKNGTSTESPPAHPRVTYSEFYRGVKQLAASLKGLGLGDGSPLFVILGNSVEHTLSTWGAYRAGCTHVSINPQSLANAAEARHMVKTALDVQKAPTAAVVVKDREMAKQWDHLFPDLDCVKIAVEEATGAWLSFGKVMASTVGNASDNNVNGQPSSERRAETSIFFTSGTTSLPKGCIIDVSAWVTALETRSTLGAVSRGDKILVLIPSSHAFGCMSMILPLTRGGTIVYTSYLGFNPNVTMETMRREECTHLVLVSTLSHALITANPSAHRGIKPLETVVFGGMGPSPPLVAEFRRTFSPRSIENLYGMTEGAFCSTGRVENVDAITKDGCIAAGLPTWGGKVRICAPGTQTPVPRGTPGEFHYSGYQIVKGYLGVESKDFYHDKDGRVWFNTGDQAVIHTDGLLYTLGRYKELIVRGGKNISPSAIESTLGQKPELYALNPQAVPLPDPVAGEVPVIVVNRTITHDVVRKIMDTVLENMGPMYIPSKIISIETLGRQDYPRTSSGKVQKGSLAALVRQYEETLASVDPDIPSTGTSSIGDKVAHIWAGTLGLSATELDLHAKLSERSDSITSMRVHSKVRRETGRDVSFAAWSSADTIAGQAKLFEHATVMGQGKKAPVVAKIRQGGPKAEDMAHLTADPSRFNATQELINKAIGPHQLSWDDVADVIPTTDHIDLLVRSHVMDFMDVHISVLTLNADSQRLRSALEAALAVNPLLLSFIVIDETFHVADRALYVTIHPTRKILDQCIIDYGVLESMEDVYRIKRRWPEEYIISMPGPLCRFLIAFVKETNSTVLIMRISHTIMDATYHDIFAEDLDRALGGQTLEPHIPFKAWADTFYHMQYSPTAQPALDYHAGQMQVLKTHKPVTWPTPTPTLVVSPDRIDDDVPALKFDLSGLLALRRHHPDITPPTIPKAALSLLALYHTKHTQAILFNLEAARSGFPFLPPSVSELGSFNAADVAGPLVTGNIQAITYDPNETVLRLLQRMQEQQRLVTKHANAPWRRIMEKMPILADLYPEAADALLFNWTGANTFEESGTRQLYQNIQAPHIFFRPKTGLMVDAGLTGKDGTDLVVSMTGTIANTSGDCIDRLGEGFRRISTWLVAQENWGRPVKDFPECLGVVC
ncbi:acetyl-CoA synthetase-like protein [Aspergillus heteromorphus CBS 117.55]|uniref:Acetyl-CoA synthetase-like protein n=1 Tax=Aspergillus heteromorphus CBS 117.55 TaxID=1448321 RepID=A0A317W220_9EURO|nr:acetyl-CoA synthetase-like protein [Aspergillus heteromorphus CBS 117.55]PWY79228.1 acetyl-CoA synthetase-like protein [Aspergillus heteromorphus CBS 117.55]